MLNRANEFTNEVQNLKDERLALAAATLAYAEMYEAFLAEARPLIDAVEAGKESVKAQEETVRTLAADWYATDDSTKVLPHGVKIAVAKQVEYDEAEATAWAKSVGMAVRLDASAFKKLAKTGAADGIPARVVEVPTVRLPARIEIEPSAELVAEGLPF